MVLEFKKINYKINEITPGIGQVSIFKLSGQRKLPVLTDATEVISDSSKIVKYLEKKYPEPSLTPNNKKNLALVHIMEDWADTTMAKGARTALIKATTADPTLRNALLPDEIPMALRNLVGGLPIEIVSELSEFLSKGDGAELFKSLKVLNELFKTQQWVVGDNLTSADIAIAAQLSLLKFPTSAGKELTGRGCPGFNDHPELKEIFEWRDNIENFIKQQSKEGNEEEV